MRKGERMEGIVSSSLIRPNEITISYDAPFALSFVFFQTVYGIVWQNRRCHINCVNG